MPAAEFPPIDDLPNPGRGWTTFYSFASDPVNDRYPASRIAYVRYTWQELEPEDGNIAFAVVDSALARAHQEGQRLAFRVMPDNAGANRDAVPKWLIDKRIGGIRYGESLGVRLFMADFDDPVFLDRAQRLLAALGARYNGHPDLDHVDLGMVGHWGEWHVSQAAKDGAAMPSIQSARRYIDMHLDAFSRHARSHARGRDGQCRRRRARVRGWPGRRVEGRLLG